MRVRIKKDADGAWSVETKAEKRALEYARILLNPVIIEVT